MAWTAPDPSLAHFFAGWDLAVGVGSWGTVDSTAVLGTALEAIGDAAGDTVEGCDIPLSALWA